MRAAGCAVAFLSLLPTLSGCTSTTTPISTAPSAKVVSVSKPGFYTEVKDGRLWVFREGTKELEDFKKQGEPAQQVTRVGGGPNGMTIKSNDASVIDEYLAAK